MIGNMSEAIRKILYGGAKSARIEMVKMKGKGREERGGSENKVKIGKKKVVGKKRKRGSSRKKRDLAGEDECIMSMKSDEDEKMKDMEGKESCLKKEIKNE